MARNRKRRKPRSQPSPQPRGYERSRQRDEEARAALKPLRPGERPTAVTVGAIVAGVFAVANLVAGIVGYDYGSEGNKLTGSLVSAAILGIVAVGMWRARYWAVLGMQTLLGITIVVMALALLQAVNAWAFILVTLLLVGSGTLFWFLIKAMARIQMPERPGSQRTG
ncbi:MAG TPA: hypothetical protein VHR40_06970 [Thermoleophilaceae bacterium]|jgi:hypothetical protein|nr:hypothetical protein [Thermoleophilaceae bacterium]